MQYEKKNEKMKIWKENHNFCTNIFLLKKVKQNDFLSCKLKCYKHILVTTVLQQLN